MSITIHHGPPGSYKTSGAIMDNFIPAALAGRVVVTNVRGLSSRTRVVDALGGPDKVPDTFELIYLPTTECKEATENRRKLATFWHWIPEGAFLFIDECNTIWSTALRDKDLQDLNFEESYLNGGQVNRPFTIYTAFEMHRHFGWDMVLTTPHISKVHALIRQCAEGAYKHKNQGLIGIRGYYLEAFHMAEDSGQNAKDFLSLKPFKKIKPVVWQLYESTATGSFSDTTSGTPFWRDPKVVIFVALSAIFVGFVLTRGLPSVLGGKRPELPSEAAAKQPKANPSANVAVPPPVAPSQVPGNPYLVQTAAVSPVRLAGTPGHPANSDVPVGPLAYANWQFLGSIAKTTDPYKATFLFKITTPKGESLIHSGALLPFGYRFSPVSSTAVRVQYENTLFLVMANPIDPQQSGAMGQTPLSPFGPAGQGTNPLRNAPGSPGAAPLPPLYRPPEFTQAQHTPNNNGRPVQLAMTPAAINQGQRVQAHTPSAAHWAIKPDGSPSDPAP